MSYRRMLLWVLVIAGAWVCGTRQASAGDEWQPIAPEELKMTSDPKAPGAPAIYLYRQVDRNDGANPHEYNYLRVKILTEEGRKYADIEIPFIKDNESIRGIKARTIRPDGTIVNFDGKIYDKTVVKAKGIKFLAKTFTLPDVQVGSIIEYHYNSDMDSRYVFDSHWILSSELFTKRAKFSLQKNPIFAMRWSWPVGLPEGTTPPKNEGDKIRLETQNVPAFQVEDYMPPENELKFRVDFIYTDENNPEKDAAKFWKQQGKEWYGNFDSFVNKRKAMEQAVLGVVSPNDDPEAKLKKIYARVQQLRNTSFEKEKTEQEQKREKQKEANNVEDVWKSAAGNGRQINWVFIALARAAGIEAYPVYLSARNFYFFHPNLMNPRRLNGDVIQVKLNGKDLYLDPGTAFTPYGLLPWEETAVQGLRLDKEGGQWVQTPFPDSSASRIERKADLKLTDDGALEGSLTVIYSGLDALWMRIEERNEDETSRKRLLEDLVKGSVPVGIEVELTNKPEWTSSAPTLVTQYSLKVPGWVSGAGRRALMPVGLFSSAEKHLFEHANRVYAVYFQYPYQKADDITIALPLGWKVGSVPKVLDQDVKAAAYTVKAEDNKGTLHITCGLRSDLLTVDVEHYGALRTFFQMVRTGDEEQIILQPGAGSN